MALQKVKQRYMPKQRHMPKQRYMSVFLACQITRFEILRFLVVGLSQRPGLPWFHHISIRERLECMRVTFHVINFLQQFNMLFYASRWSPTMVTAAYWTCFANMILVNFVSLCYVLYQSISFLSILWHQVVVIGNF